MIYAMIHEATAVNLGPPPFGQESAFIGTIGKRQKKGE